MDVKEIIGLIAALVVANWSALAKALKCRDKMDAARNLLWGLSSDHPPESTAMVRFILKFDILGFLIALVWIFLGVGAILVLAAYYMFRKDLPWEVVALYASTGSLMILSGIGTGIVGWRGYKETEAYALECLRRLQSRS
ncbi:MAG: hypothetical protein P8Z76_07005 [Alphaproteobacteria bacterium]